MRLETMSAVGDRIRKSSLVLIYFVLVVVYAFYFSERSLI